MKIKGEFSLIFILLSESFLVFTFFIRNFEERVDYAWEKRT
jgi:hypothetical protein